MFPYEIGQRQGMYRMKAPTRLYCVTTCITISNTLKSLTFWDVMQHYWVFVSAIPQVRSGRCLKSHTKNIFSSSCKSYKFTVTYPQHQNQMFHHLVHHTLLLLPHPSPGLVHREVHPQDSPKNNKIQLSKHVKDNSCLLVGRRMNRSNHNEWTHKIWNKNKGLVAANVKLKTKPIHTQNSYVQCPLQQYHDAVSTAEIMRFEPHNTPHSPLKKPTGFLTMTKKKIISWSCDFVLNCWYFISTQSNKNSCFLNTQTEDDENIYYASLT